MKALPSSAGRLSSIPGGFMFLRRRRNRFPDDTERQPVVQRSTAEEIMGRGASQKVGAEITDYLRPYIENFYTCLMQLQDARTDDELDAALYDYGRAVGDLVAFSLTDLPDHVPPDIVREYVRRIAETTGHSEEDVWNSDATQRYYRRMTRRSQYDPAPTRR